MSTLVASQDFNWHDAGQGGTYVFGEDGYLKMDGSRGRVICSRRLGQPVSGPEDALELRLRVVLGKRYSIHLYGAQEYSAIECQIDANGLVSFARQGKYVGSGRSLTFQRGQPYADPTKRKWYVVESDEHLLRFERFDFTNRAFAFVLDEAEPVILEGCLATDAMCLTSLQVQTHDVEVGSMIRLREYSQYRGGALVERERFPLHWKAIQPPADGMPDDNVCETLMRPVDYRWLETRTQYGYVKVGIPSLPAGTIEFQMKTADASNESCLILEEYEGIIKGGSVQVGLLGGKMILFTGGEIMQFDQPVEVADERVYGVKLSWDNNERKCRVWLDEMPMSCAGSYVFPLINVPKRGIDTITLHPGDAGARLTSLQRRQGLKPREVPPLLTYWGRFRVYDSAA